MTRFPRLALLLAAALILPTAAHARERAADLPTGGTPNLALSGERVLWVEQLPAQERGAGPVRVQVGAPGAAPRTLIAFPGHPGTEGITAQYASIQASATHVAVARRVQRTTGMTMHSAGNITVLVDELWAGPVDGELTRITSCDGGPLPRPSASDDFGVSGSRVVHQACDESRDLVVRDLATGSSRTIPRGGLAGGRHVDLAGRFVAWEERREEPSHGLDGSNNPRTLVIHDLEAGRDVLRVDQPRLVGGTHGDVYLQEDGKLLDPMLGSDTEWDHGVWYSEAEPGGRRVEPGNTWGLAGDRTLRVHRLFDVTTFAVHGLDGSLTPVARAHSGILGLVETDFDRSRVDFDGDRVAWSESRCGDNAIYTHRVGEPVASARSFLERRCASVSLPKRPLKVARSRHVLVPVKCNEMKTCAGRLRVLLADGSVAGRTTFNFRAARRGTVRVRLSKAARRARSARFVVLDRDQMVLADRTVALRP